MADDDEYLPFSKEIKEMPISDNFVCPMIEKYNGKGDMTYHLFEYMTKMKLKKGKPRTQVPRLPPNIGWTC